MSPTEKLKRAILEVTSSRTLIIDRVHLKAEVFDSWLEAVQGEINKPEGSQSLPIILSWIEEIPELGRARDEIRRQMK